MSRELWRTLGYLYDGLFALKPHRQLVQEVADTYVVPGRLTIDYGCGTGWLEALAADDRDIEPVDFSATMLARARQRCTRPPHEASVTQLPFASNHFDTGIAINLLYAVPADQQALAVQEMARVLKPGGRFVIANPVSSDLAPLLREHFASATWRDHLRLVANIPRLMGWMAVLGRKRPNFHFLPEDQLIKLLESAHLMVESCEPCYAGIDRLIVAHKEA